MIKWYLKWKEQVDVGKMAEFKHLKKWHATEKLIGYDW